MLFEHQQRTRKEGVIGQVHNRDAFRLQSPQRVVRACCIGGLGINNCNGMYGTVKR
jgi:hypothetical protein